MAWKGVLGLNPYHSLFASWQPWGSCSQSRLLSTHPDVLPCHTQGQVTNGWKSPKLWAKIVLPFQLFISGILSQWQKADSHITFNHSPIKLQGGSFIVLQNEEAGWEEFLILPSFMSYEVTVNTLHCSSSGLSSSQIIFVWQPFLSKFPNHSD
jgi:hypothetical protein